MANEPTSIRQAQLEDWIEDLFEFDLNAILSACSEWRRKPGAKRPTPGDIRTACIEVERENRIAIAGKAASQLDSDIIREWSKPEYDGDTRNWQQRRADALEAVKQRYCRAEQWRKANPA